VRSNGSVAASAGAAMAIMEVEAAATMAHLLLISAPELRAEHLTGPIWTDTGATRTGAARRVPAKEAQAPTTGEAAVTRPAMASLMYLLVPGI